jgi:8-oxo-dGTP diphosphatase
MSRPVGSQTILVSAAVILHEGRVLMTQRPAKTHLGGTWEFPGGKVEPGEDPRDTVVRECREECAIDIEVRDILEVTFHSYPEKDVLLLFWECALVGGTVQHLGVADHQWIHPASVADLDLPPADAPLAAKLRARFPR